MINIQNVFKTYRNGKTALQDINLDIKKGEFTAILGPNGAGKTTLINILAGNVKKTAGSVFIGSKNLDTEELETKKIIGIVPQEISFDSFFNVDEVLRIQSGYFGIQNNKKYITELLEELSLADKRYINTKALSGGMKRRLLIAKALIHKPKILILDEPTAGVDIELRQSLYAYLKRLHNAGTTIILTTHYLEEAEHLCKRIIILNHGRIIADDLTRNLIKSLGEELELQFIFKNILTPKDMEFLNEFHPQIDKTKLVLKATPKRLGYIFNEFTRRGLEYLTFDMKETHLEDVFLSLTKK